MNKQLIMDTGYSSLKGFYNGEYIKIPTSVAFYNQSLSLSNTNPIYELDGDKYLVGDSSISEESFSTTDFSIKKKFEPLFIKLLRDKLNINDDEVVDVTLSLALVDWSYKDELVTRCSEFIINGTTIKNNITIIPQGIGSYADYKINQNDGKDPNNCFLIDIGYNTINAVYIEDGKVNPSKSKGYPNHGVNSIIKKFTSYLENKFSLPFSEQEAIKIFRNGKFIYKGELVEDVSKVIEDYKIQFVKTLFNSVLIADKKLMNISEVVVLSGGGTYYLENIQFPPNVTLVQSPYEFSNCRGMVKILGL